MRKTGKLGSHIIGFDVNIIIYWVSGEKVSKMAFIFYTMQESLLQFTVFFVQLLYRISH